MGGDRTSMPASLAGGFDPLFDVSERVYVIAGAGGGLGRAITRALAKRQARLVLLDTDQTALEGLCQDVPGALPQMADMGDEAAVTGIIESARQQFGRLDGAVNAAGLLPIARAEAFSVDAFRQCLDVNVTSAFLFSRCVAQALGDQGGRIMHLASVSSFVANPEYAAYSSSKAALAQMVKVLAREWAPRKILVNAIGPALTETDLTRDYLADMEFRKNAISAIPLGRLGEPDDIVATALLLLSPGGAFITGQTIYVDGGRTLV